MGQRPPWGPPERRGCRPGAGWDHGFPPRSRWRSRPRFLFLRLTAIVVVLALLLQAWLAALSFLLTRLFGGGAPAALLVWVAAVSLFLMLPLLVVGIGIRAFRRFALPLSDLIAAADAVVRGDLSVRVPVVGMGGLSRLAGSFNHMTAQLERADRQRRNLTADVAHELRNPLHVIQGNLEGILDGVYQPTEEHINATLSETRVLARLVEDLRTLSLAEAGQLPLSREEVDVGDLLADVGTSFSGQAEAAGIDLRTDIAGGDGMVLTGDPGRLDQVLSNLVVNALRHTPAGGTISLTAEPLAPGQDGTAGVRITVSDTGEGIAPEDLPYVFDRFWRGDPARTHTRGAGSGLGLAIARQLVQAHGGHIAVESQPGAGTRFTIDLPAGSDSPSRAGRGE